MIVTIAYFVFVAAFGVPWSPWVAVPTFLTDAVVASQVAYWIHGPREKWERINSGELLDGE